MRITGTRLLLCALLVCLQAHAQVDLNANHPSPQVKGITQVQSGGLGISTAGMSGCPKETAGVWSVSSANCAGTVPFTINSFSGGQAGELGQSFVNPVFSATYSATPTSANITNTDSINSPFTLITPFISATITGTFMHTSTAATVFTLNATQSSSQTATQTITWNPAVFGGVGAAGATSTVTASGTTAVLSTTDVLARSALGIETVGQSFGPYVPSGQNVYLLLTGGSHTFIDSGTGFPFAFNAPTTVTFVNQYGTSVTMYLYQSTNALFGTFTPKVAS